MGFAWHKLIPRRLSGTTDCPPPPPPCTDPDETATICVSTCYPNVGGTQICSNFCEDVVIGGPPCGGGVVLGSGIQSNPLEPVELRINSPMYCYVVSNSTPENIGICDFEERTGVKHNYYYRTPNSPSASPAQITGSAFCMKYNAFSVPDRAMVISGRNRYKYFGWGADPSCDGTIPAFWDSAGGSGIKQNELSISGRSWPAANSVLDLPLFGGQSSLNPVSTYPCANGTCTDQSCFSPRLNDGIGHYAPPSTSSANGTGYYSFQCFNPQSYVNNGGGGFVPVPTCSVWSLVHAVWYNLHGGDEASYIDFFPSVKSAIDSLFAADPSENQLGTNKQNVRYYLETLADALLSQAGYTFIIPNVFLWDRDAFLSAGNNTDKWKHIYVVGNANVIFDTQCTNRGSGADISRFGFVFHLDEVSHDVEYGSTGNARIIQWFGCNPSNENNGGSIAELGVTILDCVPTNPKGGIATFCSICQNEDSQGSTDVDQLPYCQYFGYRPSCLIDWLFEGP